MATNQQVSNTRSEAAKKAAATRAANKAAGMPEGKNVGPTGKNMPAANTDANNVPTEQRQGERRQQQQNLAQQFTPTEQNTPAVHEQPQSNAAPQGGNEQAFQQAVQALAESMGVQAPPMNTAQPANTNAQPAPQRAQRQTKNNITRPDSNTITGSIWDLADKISAAKNGNGFAAIAELRADPSMKEVNEHTLKTQYARWRSYNGLHGRQDAAPQAAAATPTGQQAPNTQPNQNAPAYNGPERRA